MLGIFINKEKLVQWYITVTLIIILIAFSVTGYTADYDTEEIVYFYISSCNSCEKIKPLLDRIEQNHRIRILRKNIGVLDNQKDFYEYIQKYEVPDNVKGIVPTIFYKSKYFVGEKEIRNLLYEIDMDINSNLDNLVSFSSSEVNKNFDLKVFAVFFAGLIDGVNPCAMSMLLFFLSLVLINGRKNTLLVGISYISGTFLAYFLLGTLLYSLLGVININPIRFALKLLLILFILMLLTLNVKDFFALKRERYGDIVLQLPLFLRKFSHKIIKQFIHIGSKIYILTAISFILGIFISITEFLCTGQIYLPTIVSMIQLSNKNLLNTRIIVLLIVYNLGFIVPLAVILIATYFGQRIINISEVLRVNLRKIKLANIIFFLAMLILVILYF